MSSLAKLALRIKSAMSVFYPKPYIPISKFTRLPIIFIFSCQSNELTGTKVSLRTDYCSDAIGIVTKCALSTDTTLSMQP